MEMPPIACALKFSLIAAKIHSILLAMTDEYIGLAKADIEATSDLLERAPIRMTWEEWKASRAAKRETLRRLGLDAPSRRSESTSDRRLRQAFGGERAPVFDGMTGVVN